ncbi:unnamed protein product [Fraxinus pennsylvanica]|uniref:Wall-associated receptor kinase galacturonan-binding domain-containing protein n=1 Tax=Fraxinus pennsylvanica TaxID=56036 RepID=A0AAD2DIC1_9LAMI|nr:unnamed protein product [Fraxinus pennsylvanica]
MQQKACILLILWLPFSLAISNQTLDNSTIALPGCPTECGNVSIPYPFGIGLDSGCSIGPWFDINCNASFNPPKPFLSKTNGEIINISDTQIRIKSNGIAYRCYNQTGGITRESLATYGIEETSPFSFSNENKFIVVGCDDVSYMVRAGTGNSISSCAALCSTRKDLSDGSCSGIGCCQNSIPKGVKKYSNFLKSYGNHTNVSSFNSCGYSFVGEPDSYTFHSSDVFDPTSVLRIVETVPMTSTNVRTIRVINTKSAVILQAVISALASMVTLVMAANLVLVALPSVQIKHQCSQVGYKHIVTPANLLISLLIMFITFNQKFKFEHRIVITYNSYLLAVQSSEEEEET